MSERVSLELIFPQGQRIIDEIRAVQAEQREQHGRMASIATELGQIRSVLSYVRADIAQLNARLDRINDRIDRIESRVNLVDST